MSTRLTDGEVRAKLGGVGLHLCRSLLLPNVLKLHILSARSLPNHAHLKHVRVEVLRHTAVYLSVLSALRMILS